MTPGIEVAVRDGKGQIISSAPVGQSLQITLALGNNAGGATLLGTKTVTSVGGVATFSDLSLDRAGFGYTLVASAVGLSATSAPFSVSSSAAPTLVATPPAVAFGATSGAALPAAQTVTISNGSVGTVSGLARGAITYGQGQPDGWLGTASLSMTTTPAVLTLQPSTTTLAAGTYTAFVPITSTMTGVTNSPLNVTVTYTVSGAGLPSVVTVVATDANASEVGADAGTFVVSRTGSTVAALPVNFTLTGTATNGVDYATVTQPVTIPAGQASVSIQIVPLPDALVEGSETVVLTIVAGGYTVGTPNSATITIEDASPCPGALLSGETRSGTISVAGEIASNCFTATQGQLLVLSLGETSPATLDPWIRLVSPTGGIVGEAEHFAAAQVSLTAPASGTYTVLVGSNDGFGRFDGTGNYRLTFVKVPGALSISPGDEGGPLINGASQTGVIPMGDVDAWTFTASQGEVLVVSMGETSPATLYPWIRLVSPTGGIVGEAEHFAAAQVSLTAPASGTYTVLVGSNDGFGRFDGTGNYRLTFVKVPGALSISPGDEGGPLINGASQTGVIPMGDVDAWTFTASQGELLVVSMGETSPATLYPWIRLVSPTGGIVGEAQHFAATQVSLTAPASGTYTVLVGSNNGFGRYDGTGDYRLTFVKVPGALSISPGDEGGPLINGASHTGTIPMGDIDAWTFTASQGELLAVSIEESSSATLDPWIRLVSPTGAIVAEAQHFAATQVSLTAPASGTYTVLIGSNNGFGRYDGVGSYILMLTK